MTSDAAEDAKSSLQSQSPDESGDADTAEMAEHGDSATKPSRQPPSGNGHAKSTANNAKDPTRPRRKKARRACYACQRAHLTCGKPSVSPSSTLRRGHRAGLKANPTSSQVMNALVRDVSSVDCKMRATMESARRPSICTMRRTRH